jgi:flagellar biosynthetic protein FliR
MEELIRLLENPQLVASAKAAGLLIPRILPILVLTPLFGGNVLPRRFRIGVTLLLVIVLLPGLAHIGPVQELSGPFFVFYAAKELLIGLTLAEMIRLMYHAFVSFGALVDLARGATIANVYDPVTQQQESILGSFFLQATIVLFLTLGGHRVVIEALSDSMIALPPHEMLPPRLVGQPAVTQMLSLLAELFIIAVRLATPALAVIVLLDVVLGLLNKVAPQIQVYFLGLTAKSVLGLLIVLLSVVVIIDLANEHFSHVMRAVRQWFTGAS